MASNKKIVPPNKTPQKNLISEHAVVPKQTSNLIVNFSKLKLDPICLPGKFNNHFKDKEHFSDIAASFLGTILPKITSHTYNEVCDGTSEGRVLHFHTIDDKHQKTVREILKEYQYPDHIINQMFEGNDIIEFTASLGHVHAARIVCHKVNNTLYLLFFDTNHHIYMNEKYLEESLLYLDCPKCINDQCQYMPYDCFAVGYLDETKLKESYNFSFPK